MKGTKRLLAMLLAFAMMVASVPTPVFAVGTETAAAVNEDGYIEIRTVEELYNIRNDLTANYILMNDIDLTEATAKGGAWDFNGNGWNPIGSGNVYGNSAFTGELDGKGHKIIGMRIELTTSVSGMSGIYVGLFANISGYVHDLTFVGGMVKTTPTGYSYGGALAGKVSSGTIENVENRLPISIGKSYVSNTTQYKYAGGIVGFAESATIQNCRNYGDVISSTARDDKYVAGIAGYAMGCTISNCFNTGTITGEISINNTASKIYASGICNATSAATTISNCYNTGDILAENADTSGRYDDTEYAAGISYESGTITQCYNTGMVSKGSYYRKAISNEGTQTNCYYLSGSGTSSTGAAALTRDQMLLSSLYSGFDFENVWVQEPAAVYPYPQLKSNIQDLRVPQSIALISMPDKTAYAWGEALDIAGCKIKLVCKDGEEELWVTEDMVTGFVATKTGEQLLTITYLGLTTTLTVTVKPKEYIPVYTVQDLYNIRNDLNANYILMNDIDLTEATAIGGAWDFNGNGWNPIGSNNVYGSNAFTGELDGNGYKIIGMRITLGSAPSGTADRYVGLFSNVTGTVKNLTILNAKIDVSVPVDYKCHVGTIAAYSSNGLISNCHVSADIHSIVKGRDKVSTACSNYTGGLVGLSEDSIVTASDFSGSIYAVSQNVIDAVRAGGICGKGGTITYCYNTADITAENTSSAKKTSYYDAAIAGGICGQGATVSFSYNAGTITTTDASDYGRNYAAGICALESNIEQCYNLGVTSGTYMYGVGSGTVTNSYYRSGSGNSTTGAVALTEEQMRIESMYVGFDFENVWILNEYANYPYPQLRSNVQDLDESAAIVSVISWPAKQTYYTGDNLALDGCTMKVTYVSGREEVLSVTEDMISGFDTNTPGEQTLTVTYRGGTDTFPVTVVERPTVTAIELLSGPTQTEFGVGTAFDFTGAQIKVSYEGDITEVVDVTADMTTGGNIHHLGKQTITVTYYGQTVTFEVTVMPITIESLVLETLPTKLAYLEGEQLDLTGMVLLTVMNNGTKTPINTGYSVSGYTGKPGTQTVTLGYLGKTTSFEVTVTAKSVVDLILKAMPTKTEYVSGQSFDPTGMVVAAIYDNGETLIVESFEISGFDDVPGLKTVVASFEGKYVAFPITVIARVITEFKITSLPAKLQYLQYDAFDPTGLEVQATYNDGVTETVTDYTVVGFSSNPGTHTVSISYAGWVDTFELTVKPRELTNLVVVAPTKSAYYLGEEFDPTGLTVTAYYNNGQQIPVDNYTLSGFDSNTPGTKTVTVSFGGKSSSFCVSVAKRSEIETNGSFIVDNLVGRLGETVRIPVTVTNNTGLAGLRHELRFNTRDLKFVGVEMKGDYSKGTLIVNENNVAGIPDGDGNPTTTGAVTVLWFSNYDVRTSGLVYELVFEICETAADGFSKVELTFAENDNGNISGENVLFGAQDGGVEVRSYWLGDLNGDRKYAMVDLVMLAQYVAGLELTTTEKMLLSADVNEDGSIDIHDVVLLNQWLLAEDF